MPSITSTLNCNPADESEFHSFVGSNLSAASPMKPSKNVQ